MSLNYDPKNILRLVDGFVGIGIQIYQFEVFA